MRDTLTPNEARRAALHAQGLARAVPDDAATGARQLSRLLRELGVLQIDSVSALVRAHYLPAHSRLGRYPMSALDDLARKAPRRMFEYWAHEASYLPVESWPLFQWRMQKARAGKGIYRSLARLGAERRQMLDDLLSRIASEGPLAASDIDDGRKGAGGWWGWSDTKQAFEWLFWAGLVTVRHRRGFERVYDLPERVLPRHVIDYPVPTPAEAHRSLIEIAASALGVATASDLRDYFRMSPAEGDPAIRDLEEEGRLLPVRVAGWTQRAWIHADARIPRRTDATALLAPFDPLIWERGRAERLFGFRYRLEIYTPADRRVHGYYVLPLLHEGRLVARLDMKAERSNARLVVKSVHAEPGSGHDWLEPLADRIGAMADWLGLDRVEAMPERNSESALLADLLIRHRQAGSIRDH